MRRRQTRARDHDVTYRDRASVDVRVELLTRIHKWRERVFYRPGRDVVYRHIDQLFGEPGQNVIDWQLIRTHWQDLDADRDLDPRGTPVLNPPTQTIE